VILVDSSVWIDYFNGRDTPASRRLDELLGDQPLWTGDLILAEVLAGFRRPRDARTARELLTSLEYADLVGPEVALLAAHNYRLLRRRGITPRGLVDVIIASFCALHGFQLLHSNRDFEAMAQHIRIRVIP
jgi:hypothetical protein